MKKLKQPWIEKWGVGERLDEGGQGETFTVPNRANPKGVLKVIVTGKKLDPKARGRMSQEITNLRAVKSAGAEVPQVLDANLEDISDLETELYFVMEFIPGQTLAKLTEARGGLGFEESIKVCLALTQTLRIAHEIPIIHRDLKPENIMVRNLESFDIVMLDFGISFHGNYGQNLTTHNESFHNALIHLPERTGVDAGKRDPRSDLTDVTAILYYCLTAQPPRNLEDEHGNPIHKTVQSKLSPKCRDETKLSKLNSFFAKGFQINIDYRFQTIDQLETRLLELLNANAPTNNEDLQTVLNNYTEQLQKNDKKTRILNFKDKIQAGIPDFEHALSEFPIPVVGKIFPGSFAPNLTELNFSVENRYKNKDFVLLTMGIAERAMQNVGAGRVYFYQLAVRNEANKITLLIEYEFQVEENECVVYRTIREPVGNSPGDVVELGEKFSSPEDVALDFLVDDVRTAVKMCIEKIMKKIQPI